ncbi:carboxypeptidase-like regulatory domain-containing protein [Roseivirga sp. E12]|uniref:carboxypeptidase-like regulatory domain-containing protein n=1 Tax=Roseivirga sp. E12 TaxID=2819237 RepID=UPI001ABBFC97|nr:carboxypeptidase-like regulatory domain-containing protein [Roseivirga sp. E12]MBO3697493.1 carboxypeptidase-like regulatory domain-containing protein [Roseivirga sp. E12]
MAVISAQDTVILLKGQVIEEQTERPVPFVNIRLNDYYYGTSTNLDGRFELKLKQGRFSEKNELHISCIGYQSLVIKLSSIEPDLYQTVRLTPQLSSLDDFVVKGSRLRRKESNQAKTVVMDAIDRIPLNRAKTNYLANSFYRHYCKEDTAYVRLTEAAIQLFQHKKRGKFVQIPEQRLHFGLNHMRRSFDYTTFAKLSHPPISLNFIMSNDLTNYEFHNPLRRNLDDYEFIIADTTSLDNDPIIVINFEPKEPAKRKLNYSGKLFVNMTDKAFIRANIKESQVFSNSIDSIRSTIDKQVFFQKVEGKYFPQRLVSDVHAEHFVSGSDQSVQHQSHVEIMVNELVPKAPITFTTGEPSEEDLRAVQYDSTFWSTYTVLEATPLEKKIIEDLSKKVSLQKQFQAINKLKEGIQSIVDNVDFQEAISTYQGTPVYTVLWAKWGVPNFYELIPSPYLRKLMKKGKVKLLMISLDEDEASWKQNRDIYGLDREYVIHKRVPLGFGDDVVQKFFQELVPDYLVLGIDGKIVDHSPPLPNVTDVKTYYNNLLKQKSIESLNR